MMVLVNYLAPSGVSMLHLISLIGSLVTINRLTIWSWHRNSFVWQFALPRSISSPVMAISAVHPPVLRWEILYICVDVCNSSEKLSLFQPTTAVRLFPLRSAQINWRPRIMLFRSLFFHSIQNMMFCFDGLLISTIVVRNFLMIKYNQISPFLVLICEASSVLKLLRIRIFSLRIRFFGSQIDCAFWCFFALRSRDYKKSRSYISID